MAMRKQEFLDMLKAKLSRLPSAEVEERLSFYCEMIDDRIEEGLSEEEAVSAVGSVDEIAAQIAADIPLSKIAKKNIKPKRRLAAWEIVLLVLGFPIWFTLLVVAVSVAFSLYAVLWSLVAVVWAVFGALAGCAFGGIVAGVGFAFGANALSGIALFGAGLVLAGLSIFLFFGSVEATDGVVTLTKKIVLLIKRCFIKKEGAEI
jgi:uncharacterized membrane protein